MTNYERLALSDKAKGIMPADIARRADAIKLWAAFRKSCGYGNGFVPSDTDRIIEAFVAGWDASAGRVSEDRR